MAIDEALRPLPPTLYCNAALTETHIHTHRAPRHTSISHLCSRVVPEHGDQEHHYFGLLGGSLPNLRGSLQNLRRSLQTTLPRLDGTSSGFLPAALWDVIWEPFSSILGLFWAGGGPGEALGPLCAAPVRPHLETCYFCFILGSPWGPFWDPVGTNFRLWIRSGGPCLTFWTIFGRRGTPLRFHLTIRPSKWSKNCYF